MVATYRLAHANPARTVQASAESDGRSRKPQMCAKAVVGSEPNECSPCTGAPLLALLMTDASGCSVDELDDEEDKRLGAGVIEMLPELRNSAAFWFEFDSDGTGGVGSSVGSGGAGDEAPCAKADVGSWLSNCCCCSVVWCCGNGCAIIGTGCWIGCCCDCCCCCCCCCCLVARAKACCCCCCWSCCCN